MRDEPTFYRFRRRTAQALLTTLTWAVLAFGAVDTWAYSIVVAAVLSLLAVWGVKKINDPFPVVATPLYLPLGLMLLAAIVQTALGTSSAPYATSGALLDWLLYAAFFFLAANTLTDASIRAWFLPGFVALVSVATLVGIVQRLTVAGAVYWFRVAPGGRPFGPFANAEHFVALITLVFPVALTLALRQSRRRHYYFAACGILAAALIGARSIPALAVVAAQFVFLTSWLSVSSFRSALRSRRRGPGFLLGLMGAGALAALLLYVSWDLGALRIGAARVESAGALLERSQQGLTRDELFETSWALIGDKPILGHGLGAFGPVFARVAPMQNGPYWSHAQCDPLELAVDAGLFGVAAQGLLLLLLLWRGRNLNVWGLVITPLAGAWAYSWFSAPMQTPAVVLAGLALLACTPGLSDRVAVRRTRTRKPVADNGRVEKPRGYYASRTRMRDEDGD